MIADVKSQSAALVKTYFISLILEDDFKGERKKKDAGIKLNLIFDNFVEISIYTNVYNCTNFTN